MFAAQSRITMTTFTTVVVFACTSLFANVESTPCRQALDCKNTQCSWNSTCLSNLRGTCNVDESKVAFRDVLPYLQDMCNAFENASSGVSSCETFKPCLENSTLVQILGSLSEEQAIEMSGLLVSPDTFCGLMKDIAVCVINEKEAGRCTFSPALLNYMMNAKQTLTELCGGNVGLVVNTALILIAAAIASFAK